MLKDNLKHLRTRKGISQLDLAKGFGLSQPTIASWESGRTEPSNDMVRRLAQCFGVSTDYLLDNESHHVQDDEETRIINMYRVLSDADKQTIRLMPERFLQPVTA